MQKVKTFFYVVLQKLHFFLKKQILALERNGKCTVYIMINIHTIQTSTVQWPHKNVFDPTLKIERMKLKYKGKSFVKLQQI